MDIVHTKIKFRKRDIPQHLLKYFQLLKNEGWILRQDIKWLKQVYHVKENYTIGTVMPASVTDRFNNSGEYLFHFVKEPKYYFNLDAVRIPKQVEGVTDLRDGAFDRSRTKDYNIKYPYSSHLPTKKYANDDIDKHHSHKRFCSGTPREWHDKGKNIPTAWLISSEPGHEDHFAKFPIRLVTIPILTTCPESGVVLDPFSGSGTTCQVAQFLKRNWIGIELSPEYVAMAENMLRQDVML